MEYIVYIPFAIFVLTGLIYIIAECIGGFRMPLVKGAKAKTKKGFGENVKREMESGKPQNQSVAIAFSEAKESKKKKRK